jgi:phosphonate transport system substrate-binding protein
MKRSIFLLAALALAACKPQATPAGGGAAPAASAAKTLRFSAIPNQNTTDLQLKFGPVAAYLTKTLGVPVEYVASADYKASVDMFKNGQIQLAFFGGVTGVQARAAVPGATAIVQGQEDTAYKSYFIVNGASDLQKSAEFPAAIAGLKFSFGSESSTSGRVMPSHYITVNSGKSEKEFFANPVTFSGGHDKTIEQVASGQAQAGVCDYLVYEKLVKEGKVDAAKARVIWETPTFPDYNFTAHPALEKEFGEGFTKKVKDALIGMGAADAKLLVPFARTALIEAKNEDYKVIEDVCKAVGLVR